MCLVDHARASTAWVPDMVDAVDDLRPRAGLSLLVGVEVKMLDRTGLLDSPEPVVGVDHILIADHQYPSEDGPVQPTDVRRMLAEGSLLPAEVAECLVEATVGATGRRERPIVAHRSASFESLACTKTCSTNDSFATLQHAHDVAGSWSKSTRSGGAPARWSSPNSHGRASGWSPDPTATRVAALGSSVTCAKSSAGWRPSWLQPPPFVNPWRRATCGVIGCSCDVLSARPVHAPRQAGRLMCSWLRSVPTTACGQHLASARGDVRPVGFADVDLLAVRGDERGELALWGAEDGQAAEVGDSGVLCRIGLVDAVQVRHGGAQAGGLHRGHADPHDLCPGGGGQRHEALHPL